MEQSAEDELQSKPQRRVQKHVQIQENFPLEPKYDALQYALFLCYGHSTSTKANYKQYNKRGTRLLVLDEAGSLHRSMPKDFADDQQ